MEFAVSREWLKSKAPRVSQQDYKEFHFQKFYVTLQTLSNISIA